MNVKTSRFLEGSTVPTEKALYGYKRVLEEQLFKRVLEELLVTKLHLDSYKYF